MKLTATPFDPTTGELLPVYRDAYLRGDLARSSAQAVEDYLRRDTSEAHSTVTRWHQLQVTEEAAAPNWVGRQLRFIREQPQRFRRRAMSFGLVGLLLAGASMAANRLPINKLPAVKMPAIVSSASVASLSAASALGAAASLVAPEMAEASNTRTVVLHGRILNEKGQPLAGATVMQKGTAYGTSTDAGGNYSLRVPAGPQTMLQYGYGGYVEQELRATNPAAAPVMLQPKAAKRKHWLFF